MREISARPDVRVDFSARLQDIERLKSEVRVSKKGENASLAKPSKRSPSIFCEGLGINEMLEPVKRHLPHHNPKIKSNIFVPKVCCNDSAVQREQGQKSFRSQNHQPVQQQQFRFEVEHPHRTLEQDKDASCTSQDLLSNNSVSCIKRSQKFQIKHHQPKLTLNSSLMIEKMMRAINDQQLVDYTHAVPSFHHIFAAFYNRGGAKYAPLEAIRE